MKLGIVRDLKGNGATIELTMGSNYNISWFTNPSENIDHAGLEYIHGRFPAIRTELQAKTFKRLYKNLFIEVTSEQLRMMQHTIGLNYSKKPYRNRFFTAESDKSWTTLVDKGLAVKGKNHPNNDDHVYFWLTQQGVEYVLGKSVSEKVYKEL